MYINETHEGKKLVAKFVINSEVIMQTMYVNFIIKINIQYICWFDLAI